MTSGKTFRLRIRTREGSIINVAQWAHDLWQAQYLISRHYTGCFIMQVVDE